MVTPLSPVTGLPMLPDGERWLIREQMAYESWTFYPNPTGRLEIVLEREEEVTEIKLHPRQGWRRAYKTTVSSRVWRKVPGTEPVVLQGDHSIAALNAAHRLMKMRAQWELRESLKGAYPPKEIEVD